MWIVALAVVVGLIAAAIAVAVASDSGSDQSNGPSKSPATTPSTLTPTTTTTTTVPTTTTTTLAPGEDRLSSASRLGYAGLGPVKLGMTFSEAESAGHVTITNAVCGFVVTPGPDSGLAPVQVSGGDTITGFNVWPSFPYGSSSTIVQIDVGNPATYTIYGVHVGSTYDDVLRIYPGAVESKDVWLTLTITSAEGRVIRVLPRQQSGSQRDDARVDRRNHPPQQSMLTQSAPDLMR